MIGWVALALALAFGGEPEVCKSTIFATKGDRWAGGRTPCIRPMRRVRPSDFGVAHRTLRCQTHVVVMNPRTGKFIIAPVLDHGPYGAMHEGRWLVKKRRSDPGRWRGCLDLTPPAAKALGHNGFEKVIVVPLRSSDG